MKIDLCKYFLLELKSKINVLKSILIKFSWKHPFKFSQNFFSVRPTPERPMLLRYELKNYVHCVSSPVKGLIFQVYNIITFWQFRQDFSEMSLFRFWFEQHRTLHENQFGPSEQILLVHQTSVKFSQKIR
jgi:hypothetical protein